MSQNIFSYYPRAQWYINIASHAQFNIMLIILYICCDFWTYVWKTLYLFQQDLHFSFLTIRRTIHNMFIDGFSQYVLSSSDFGKPYRLLSFLSPQSRRIILFTMIYWWSKIMTLSCGSVAPSPPNLPPGCSQKYLKKY